MRVELNLHYSENLSNGAGREQPWTTGETDKNFRYYNFRNSPELIESVLEDFSPLADYEAVGKFYELIRFLNGTEAAFESNDCGLQIKDNVDDNGKRLRAHGRLMIFIRELAYNTDEGSVNYYLAMITEKLLKTDPAFELGAVLVTRSPTRFLEISKEPEKQIGYSGEIIFWAWGDDETETMNNLARVFDNLSIALHQSSEFINRSMAKRDSSVS